MSWAAAGQLYAIVIAIVTPLAVAVAVYRTRRWSYVVLLGQFVLFMEIGAIAYVIDPSPAPSLTPMLVAAFVVLAVDLVFMVWTLYRRSRLLQAPTTIAQIDAANDRGLISRVPTIGVVVLLLLNFKPWVGIACLVANVAWAFIWIPRPMRSYRMAVASDIGASPAAIFPYLVDPERWKLYRASREPVVVSVRPEGPLARGSEIVTRMTGTLGRRIRPYVVDSTSIVTELVPDRSYSTLWKDRPSERAKTRLEPTASGTRLTFELEGVQPYRPASMGTMLDVRDTVGARVKELTATYARLKQIVEASPSQ